MALPISCKLTADEIPPLRNGDRLTRAEFERRYEAMPHLRKAELIEGVVYLVPPAGGAQGHARAQLLGWLGWYSALTPGVEVGAHCSVRLDGDNEPQPDALLLIDPALGGQARISADDYVESAPELVAEVAASSVSIDLNTKLNVYRRNGVLEYLVWRVLNRQVDWFVLREDRYERLQPDEQGLLRSTVFPGLWLDAAALVNGDLAHVLAVVRDGLASPEHTAFVGRLQPPSSGS